MTSLYLVRIEDLREYSAAVLQAVDVPPVDAEVITKALLDAELHGLDTHGAVRLPQYVTLIKLGSINPRPEIKVVNESANHALVDNGYGLGFLGSVKAMDLCIAKAKRTGIAMAGVCNSSHFGAAGYYARMAAEQDLIGFATSNSYPVMAPPGSITRTHGNNPFAFAIPSGKRPPIVLDMATSVVSQGKIKKYVEERRRIPLGWANDRAGKPTDDPEAVFFMLPLGEGGYKGYGLAVVMDALAGVLTGSLFARNFVSGPGSRGCGHFFMTLDPQLFFPLNDFKKRMDEMAGQIKDAKLPEGNTEPIYYPGERGFARKEKGLKEGIPLLGSTVKLLDRLSDDLGLSRLKRIG
jgi:LDH2 family malate/lactate/ureidoglycolate dehydrogenase